MVDSAPHVGRVVIVTAAVGEGHAAAARALAAELAAESPGTDVVICDALEGLGRLLRLILLDAYRWQLRFAPWVFGLLYGLFRRFPPARRLGAIGLAALGGRSLLRLSEALEEVVEGRKDEAPLGFAEKQRAHLRETTCASATVAFWRNCDTLRLVRRRRSCTSAEASPSFRRRTRAAASRR